MSDQNKNVADNSMKTPAIIAIGMHVVILLLVIFGLPHFMDPPEEVEPIPVQMVADISELTSSNKPPVKAPKPKEEPKKETPPPPKAEATRKVQKSEEAPPDAKELKDPPKETPKKDDLAPPKPKKEKQPEKKVEPKKQPKKEDAKDDFDVDKLLKDLAPDDKLPQPEETETLPEKLMTTPEPSPSVSRFSDALSISEQDALRQQLAGCWNINPGLRDAQDLAVEIKVKVNPDRTVASAEVVDTGRYNSDTFFRTMADSALRAVRNPLCSPLRLPENKYNLWRDMTVVFDPKEMF